MTLGMRKASMIFFAILLAGCKYLDKDAANAFHVTKVYHKTQTKTYTTGTAEERLLVVEGTNDSTRYHLTCIELRTPDLGWGLLPPCFYPEAGKTYHFDSKQVFLGMQGLKEMQKDEQVFLIESEEAR